MCKFKVGDRVRILSAKYGAPENTIETIREIVGEDDVSFHVDSGWWYDPGELELVEGCQPNEIHELRQMVLALTKRVDNLQQIVWMQDEINQEYERRIAEMEEK